VAVGLGDAGACGQVVLQRFGIAVPELFKPLPARQPVGLQLRGQRCVPRNALGEWIELQGRVAIEVLQHAGQPLGLDAPAE
jgi:hypothetical protein